MIATRLFGVLAGAISSVKLPQSILDVSKTLVLSIVRYELVCVRCKPFSVYIQRPRSTQPGHPSVGKHNEYQ